MRLVREAVTAYLAMASVAACSVEHSPPQTAARVSYTCCDANDIDTLYQPGQTMTVHWIVKPLDGTAGGSPQVELDARLTGPFTTVSDLKSPGNAGAVTFTAAPIRPSGTAGEQPVSTIPISSDAQPGYYNLIFSVTEAGGTFGGASIVRVVARA